MNQPIMPANLLPLLLFLSALLLSTPLAAFEPGESMPDFTLPLLSTETSAIPEASAPEGSTPEGSATLSDYRSQWVYVDFWASWCGPCRQSMPLYETLFQEFTPQQLQILAINLDEFPQDATEFLAKHPVTYTVLWDPAGNTPREWNIKAMPSSFLLDKDGKLVRAWAGFEESHIQEIRDVLLDHQTQ